MTSRLSVHAVAISRSQIAISTVPRVRRRMSRAVAGYDARLAWWDRLMFWIVG